LIQKQYKRNLREINFEINRLCLILAVAGKIAVQNGSQSDYAISIFLVNRYIMA